MGNLSKLVFTGYGRIGKYINFPDGRNQVFSVTKELFWTNSKFDWVLTLIRFSSIFSYPGFYGKIGIRVFHKQNNRHFCQTINTDKLLSLVTESTINSDAQSKDMVFFIDFTKSVRRVFLSNRCFSTLKFVWFNLMNLKYK